MDNLSKEVYQTECGKRLKRWREQIHLTQEELAEIIGYADSKYISLIECGKRSLTPKKARLVSENTKQRLDNDTLCFVRKEWLLCESDIMTSHELYLECAAATEQWIMNSGYEMNGCAHDLIEAAIKNICIDKWESEGLETDKIIEKHIENDFPVLPEADFMLIKNLVVDYAYSLVYNRLNNEKKQPLWQYAKRHHLKEL